MEFNADFEMVIGLISPIGVDLDKVINCIKKSIQGYDYDVHVIQVVDLPNMFEQEKEATSRVALENLSSQMPTLRKIAHKHLDSSEADGFDIYSALIVNHIKKIRKSSPKVNKRLYILDNLKHPKDIEVLQRVYKKAFYTIGVTADVKQRILYKHPLSQQGSTLNDVLSNTQGLNKAAREIYEDFDFASNEGSHSEWSNSISNAYQLSDFFINLGEFSNIKVELDLVIQRFIDLICGAPIITPTAREHSMFLAYMYSLRSADLSRQVGSTITNEFHDVLALGANETPMAGGGQYWADEAYIEHTKENQHYLEKGKDQRDYIQGLDVNSQIKGEIFNEIVNGLIEDSIIDDNDEIRSKVKSSLKATSLNDITEYGRVVHAEMSSLMSAARNGISVRGSKMYCTTYPCHNCAKHIIASGIKSVEYIEPYPKSKASRLHNDSIFDPDAIIEEGEFSKEEIIEKLVDYVKEPNSSSEDIELRVRFVPYAGVGPTRYLDLFSMKLGESRALKRKNGPNAIYLERSKATMPRVPVVVAQIKFSEDLFMQEFDSKGLNVLKDIVKEYKDEIGISSNKKQESTIRFWHNKEEYGYIVTQQPGKDYAFKRFNLVEEKTDIIKDGAKVRFFVKQGKDGIFFADEIEFV